MSGWKISPNGITDFMNFYMDKTKRLLLINPSDPTQIIVQGATYGPIPIKVGSQWFNVSTDLAISTASNMDTGSIAPGLDYYIYACNNAGVIAFVISLNATYPTGYTALTSRKIGGFHTLCSDVGTISGHLLTGFTAGQILPNSVWDLKFRAASLNNAGLVYDPNTRLWIQIYMASDNGASGVQSVYGATILDSITWNDIVDRGGVSKMRCLRDDEFQVMARNSNEQTNIYGSNDPVTTGKCAIVIQTTGTGLNDASVDASIHTLGVAGYQEYEITIDATGTPDTFKWRQRLFAGTYGTYTNGVVITGAFQTLANGVKIKFLATTGHTLNNVFSIWVANGNRDIANRRMISDIGIEEATGIERQWLLDQSYRYDLNAAVVTDAAASSVATVYYSAVAGGNPIYLKYDNNIPYLCCNMANATVDKVITFGTNQKFIIKHDATANTGLPIYIQYNATNAWEKLLVNNTILGKDNYLETNFPSFQIKIKHDASAASHGVALNYDDGTDNRLEAVIPSSANTTFDLTTLGPLWNYIAVGGNKGSIYLQGIQGDVKLAAGGTWSAGANGGSRSRYSLYSRWFALTYFGGRFASESI